LIPTGAFSRMIRPKDIPRGNVAGALWRLQQRSGFWGLSPFYVAVTFGCMKGVSIGAGCGGVSRRSRSDGVA